ncbi:AAA family ATPase [Tenacibaculum sp. MEBiC06402]|uniref:AAA family ATPase n=1 Tax=unclassified Tenacibaculum TaxID=2635139 RepID=UPI003B9A9DB3
MTKLSIKLNQKYKSFENGFSYSFEGNLVLLSGINGTGKSQLLNIILGQEGKNSQNKISSIITLNNALIKIQDIDFRSFKENIAIREITASSSQSFIQSAQNAWNNYNKTRLNPNNKDNFPHLESIITAKNILLENFEEQEFNTGKISQEDLKKCLKSNNFIWKAGDVFTNSIGEIFFNHALKVSEKMKDVGRANFDTSKFEISPWAKLNNLFEELGLQYRFKDNYEIIGVEINEQPKLFALKPDGSLDENDTRLLSDLSDGEKTIISLCFASLGESSLSTKKLLLLDELDAVLNPSLIQIFFSVIKRYFIDQGIMVIMTTHSPATIGLSTTDAKYYEVFKPNTSGNRILEVSRDSYSELQIVNEEFYSKIYDQENRIRILEGKIISSKDFLIITEGKTDWKYFIKALEYFHSKGEFENITQEMFYRFGSETDVESSVCGTEIVNELSDSKLNNYLKGIVNTRDIDKTDIGKIRVGIYDSDTNTKVTNESTLGVYSFKIEPSGISTEFLFSDNEIKTEVNGRRLFIGDEFEKRSKINLNNNNLTLGGDSSNTNKAGKRVIIDTDVYNRERTNIALTKELFAQAVFENTITISEASYENFRHVFVKINEFLPESSKETDS